MAVDVTQPVFPPTTRMPITSQWGGAVSEGVIQRFTSVADRNAKWLSPPLGSMCVTTDTLTLWMWNGSAWVRPVSPLKAFASSAASNSPGASTVVSTGMTVTFGAVTGRSYKITYYEPQVLTPAAAGAFVALSIRLTNAAGAVQTLVYAQTNSAAQYTVGVTALAVITAAATGEITYVGCSVANNLTGGPTLVRSEAARAFIMAEALDGG